MKSKFFLLISILLLSTSLIAQKLDWATKAGGSGADIGSSTAEDQNGSVVSVGWFSGFSTFGSGSSSISYTSNGDHDIFVMKQNASGNLTWVKSIGGGSTDRGISVATDHNSNIYLSGYFEGTVDFNPGQGSYLLSSSGREDAYVVKLDSSGGFIWAKSFGGGRSDVATALRLDAQANVYLTGWFHGTVDFDPSNSTFQLSTPSGLIPDAYILKLDSSGQFVFAKHFTGNGQNLGYNIEVDSAQNIYATGSFSSSADFDPNSSTSATLTASGIDAYVVKLDHLGDYLWAKKVSSSNTDIGYGISLDQHDNLYLAGYNSANASIDNLNLSNNGGEDAFVIKFNASGSVIWGKSIGGTGDDQARGVRVDEDGGLYLSGFFRNNVVFNSNTPQLINMSNGGADWFLLKLDSLGAYTWVVTGGGSGNEAIYETYINHKKSIYISGKFQNTMDVDPDTSSHILTASSANINDIFIAKYLQCRVTNSQQNIVACNSYTSPSGIYTWNSSGVYQDTIQNVGGCDSVITINLQIKQSSSNVIFRSTCDQYTSPSGKYTWFNSGTYTDTITNSNGCDSTLIIGLILNQSTNDTIVETVCNQSNYYSPSLKYLWTSDGIYQDTIPNAIGCDSLITIDLSFENIDTTVNIFNDSLVANQSGANYQWVDCLNNYSPLIGDTLQSFKPNTNGRYALVVSKNNCTDTSSCYQMVVTGISELTENNLKYSIFPNPTNGFLNVDFNLPTSLSIYDASAQLVFQRSSMKGKGRIDLATLPGGVYLVRGVSSNGVFLEKLILAK